MILKKKLSSHKTTLILVEKYDARIKYESTVKYGRHLCMVIVRVYVLYPKNK